MIQAFHLSALRSVKGRARSKIGRIKARLLASPQMRWGQIFFIGMWEQFKLALVRSSPPPLVIGRPKGNLKVAFVLPWYGQSIVGGAEAATFDLVQAIKQHKPHIDVEVITTTLKEFVADWNTPAYSEGVSEEQGIRVRRFHPKIVKRDLFHFLNGSYLMPGGTQGLLDAATGQTRSPVPAWAEAYYLKNMIVSPSMIDYFSSAKSSYDFFIFVPYMFSPTVLGSLILGRQALVMPCLHDERYAYMRLFKRAFSGVGGFLCLVKSEQSLSHRLYPKLKKSAVIGAVVDTHVAEGNALRFREKFACNEPFILYAGRHIEGKNLPLLVDRFKAFKLGHPSSRLKLVLLGKGDLNYDHLPDVINLGFVSSADKADAYAASLCLCQPSLNESFSLVIMEAWLQKTPVIVHRACEVTRDHALDSGGGFAFDDQGSFNAALEALLSDGELRRRMGESGREYVLARYAPERVVESFASALDEFAAIRS